MHGEILAAVGISKHRQAGQIQCGRTRERAKWIESARRRHGEIAVLHTADAVVRRQNVGERLAVAAQIKNSVTSESHRGSRRQLVVAGIQLHRATAGKRQHRAGPQRHRASE